MYNDTITAISTPEGIGAVGMVRIAGEKAFEIAKKIISRKSDIIEPRRIYLGVIRNESGLAIDEVTFAFFPAPRSYCGDDTVEIFTHANPVLMDMVIDRILSQGARMALPGEFTRRAFLNGKIDLTQAESVADIINARAQEEVKTAAKMISGKFSAKVKQIRDSLIDIIAWTEASIDFPEEEDAVFIQKKQFEEKLRLIIDSTKVMAQSYKQGKLIRDGIRITIAGRTNAGKSSLMNAIFDEEKSIVTPIHGTTRDIVEGTLNIEGVKVIFRDTAGLRKPKDIVEREGIRRAQASVVSSDMVLYIIDGSLNPSPADKKFLDRLKNKNVVAVINKTDISSDTVKSAYCDYDKPVCFVSAKTHHGILELMDIIGRFIRSSIRQKEGCDFAVNLRQHKCLKAALTSLRNAKKAISAGVSEEFFVEHLKDTARHFEEITGAITSDDILDRIFSSFCIGK